MLYDYVGSEHNYMKGALNIASTYGGFFEDAMAEFPAMPATSFNHEFEQEEINRLKHENELMQLRIRNRELKNRLGEF